MHIGLVLDFGDSNRLLIAYDGSPKCFSTYGAGYSTCINSQVCIMCINCAHIHTGFFLDFGCSGRLDIAYDGSPKCFSLCGAGYSPFINPVYAQGA